LIGLTKLIFQLDGKQPLERDKLYKRNKGTAKTILQLIKKQLEIMSGPGFVLLVIFSNLFRTSVLLKVYELRFTSIEL
jgi:hypothetical protein